MAEVVGLPKLSDTMEEGGIAKWLKKEGDSVSEGEPLVEIETDKATQEFESNEEGIVVKILAQAGQTVAVGAPICIIAEEGEDVDVDALVKEATPAASAKSSEKSSESKSEPEQEGAAESSQSRDSSPTPAAQSASSSASAPQQRSGGRVRSSPLARKMAKEAGIDLNRVTGTGPNGRVIKRDVENAPAGGSAAGQPAAVSHDDQVLPVSMMRKTIAKRLLAGKNDAPHFYLTRSADMTQMMAWRSRLNEDLKKDDSLPKVSVNDLIMMACGKALRAHPKVNSSWQGDHILQYGWVHVCMAVALPEGLITPVVRHTDQLGVREIARQTKDLGQRAKSGNLASDEYAGGTFTVSNLGMLGIEEFTAIINPPQACILAVGTTLPTPWVSGEGEVVVQPRMKMTMSCDHRVVDGATGAEFLQSLVGFLEDPLKMLS